MPGGGAQFQRGRQRAGAGATDAVQPGQVACAAVQQCTQGAVRGQQRAGGRHRIAAGGAGAEEQRQQFRVGQRAGAAGQQLFAGTFVFGPVADVHGRRIRGGGSPRHRSNPCLRVSWRPVQRVRKVRGMQASTPSPDSRRVLLCVCGGIAAYKSAELVRRLRDAGCEVTVAMTENAQRFVGAQTFQALSHRPVRTSLWDAQAEAAMGHLELARWAQQVVIAPATANSIAKLAHGLADDLVSTLCLATTAPLAIAPAMNHVMWQHPDTRANIETQRSRGVQVIGPNDGPLAEGESGPGRMAGRGDRGGCADGGMSARSPAAAC
jgi:phosphopantothenoylcysteine decarboxylase/phosphopantothenate--cysteine ligase